MSSACSSGSSGGGASNGGGGGLISPGTAVSAPAPAPVKVPPPIREFLKSLDDQEWQTSLYSLLQSQTFNQVEVDLFELLCKVLDQNLFAQVDWARNSCFFKELKVGFFTSLIYVLLFFFLSLFSSFSSFFPFFLTFFHLFSPLIFSHFLTPFPFFL